MASFIPSSRPQAATYAAPPTIAPGAPVGLFNSGTKVQVGSHRVVVDRYLSEGGFAHVYLVRVPTSGGGNEIAVLKRVAVPDKDALANMRTEVETMKKLKGHKHIVTYIDSHASQLKAGGYEVFLLMEYCDGGGLIDFMNTRLKNRLTEPEILKIFSDTAEGVACMHYLKPPLLHRDLKVENILISKSGSSQMYKLCDFGSTAPPRPAATSGAEGRLIEEDIQKHTTLQYRSPEMIDVYRKKPIDEKSDIWALGVLLYKLCYYTTPFEEQGQMAILTASFKYPAYPQFSDRLKTLIAMMLMADPAKRPNIYEVLKEICSMRGKPMPIKDIYASRTPSEARGNQRLPSPGPNVKSPPAAGVSHAPLEPAKQAIPDITPMRRGRPTSTQPVPKGRDPFAALDSPSFTTRSKAIDELSAKYPPADSFSILQGGESKFEFDKTSEVQTSANAKAIDALSSEVFASRSSSLPTPDQSAPRLARAVSVKKSQDANAPQVQTIRHPDVQKPLPDRPKMISVGTMTEDGSATKPLRPKPIPVSDRPIWRVPTDAQRRLNSRDLSERRRPVTQVIDRETFDVERISRPSLDGQRPSNLEVPRSLHRSHSADEHLSPTKVEEQSSGIHRSVSQRVSGQGSLARNNTGEDLEAISSNVEYLRELERDDSITRSNHRRNSSLNRLKRTSMPPLSASAAKNLFQGKFGSAFKRFEAGNNEDRTNPESSPDTSPEESQAEFANGSDPANVSVPTETLITETEELSPEMRRELERHQLAMEEKRVADAASAYRSGSGPPVGSSRATAIQNRVRTLLDESSQASPVRKTASGYGKYTDATEDEVVAVPESASPYLQQRQSSKPVTANVIPRQLHTGPANLVSNTPSYPVIPATSQQSARPQRPVGTGPRPNAPPKPVGLRTGGPTMQPVRPSKPPDLSSPASSRNPASVNDGDWEGDFSKRYPSLNLEMVESEISKATTGNDADDGMRQTRVGTRIRDV